LKYAAIVTYTSGSRSGAIIRAKSLKDAWDKLQKKIPMEHLQSIDLAEIPSKLYEVE